MKFQAIVSSLAFAIATLGLSATAMADQHDTGETTTDPETQQSEGAATGQQDNTELFNQLDANSDGVISEDEAAAIPGLEEQFDDLDQDDSGDLDEQEFQEYQPEGESAF